MLALLQPNPFNAGYFEGQRDPNPAQSVYSDLELEEYGSLSVSSVKHNQSQKSRHYFCGSSLFLSLPNEVIRQILLYLHPHQAAAATFTATNLLTSISNSSISDVMSTPSTQSHKNTNILMLLSRSLYRHCSQSNSHHESIDLSFAHANLYIFIQETTKKAMAASSNINISNSHYSTPTYKKTLIKTLSGLNWKRLGTNYKAALILLNSFHPSTLSILGLKYEPYTKLSYYTTNTTRPDDHIVPDLRTAIITASSHTCSINPYTRFEIWSAGDNLLLEMAAMDGDKQLLEFLTSPSKSGLPISISTQLLHLLCINNHFHLIPWALSLPGVDLEAEEGFCWRWACKIKSDEMLRLLESKI
jgi:hypothetical protein